MATFCFECINAQTLLISGSLQCTDLFLEFLVETHKPDAPNPVHHRSNRQGAVTGYQTIQYIIQPPGALIIPDIPSEIIDLLLGWTSDGHSEPRSTNTGAKVRVYISRHLCRRYQGQLDNMMNGSGRITRLPDRSAMEGRCTIFAFTRENL